MLKLNNLIGFGTGGAYVPTVIGEEYGGGYYMGTIVISSVTYYLVCPPVAGQDSAKIWKTTNTTTIGTTSTDDGSSNTAAMSTAGIALHPAGQFCVNLTIGGFSDWYMPSKDELNYLYVNHAALTSAGAGTFADTWYLSSTEVDAGHAWEQNPISGTTYSLNDKGHSTYVRAIRRVAA